MGFADQLLYNIFVLYTYKKYNICVFAWSKDVGSKIIIQANTLYIHEFTYINS